MGLIKNLTAGFLGSIALNILHENLRKNATNVPKINFLGEEALNKTRIAFGNHPITDDEELYKQTLKADLISNTMYYSMIGGKSKYIWPKAIILGLTAGVGAIKLPKPLGLDPEPVAGTEQMKALTIGYYLFGALVTGLALKILQNLILNTMENKETSRDSTNNTQDTKDHIKTLEGTDAVKKLKDLATSAENCFFCTNIRTGLPISVRPMSVQHVDEAGNLWFMSRSDSNKNSEIASDPFTHLFFQENKNSGFLNIYGISEVINDRAKIDELWNPLLKVWFQEGKDDPKLSLIKVEPTNVYYWDTKHGEAIAFIKMATSIITGKTMDDSVEGNLNF